MLYMLQSEFLMNYVGMKDVKSCQVFDIWGKQDKGNYDELFKLFSQLDTFPAGVVQGSTTYQVMSRDSMFLKLHDCQ